MRVLTLVSFLAVGFGTTLFASPFTNGSFEAPVLVTSPDFGTVTTGWVKSDPSGIGLFMQLDTTFGIPFVPANGHQSYGFGGNGVTVGSLSQTFDTVAGVSYRVDFQYLIQQGPEQEAMRIEAFNGLVSLGSGQFAFSNNIWANGLFNFVAQSAATTLTFSDATGVLLPGVGNNTNWALDAVTVTQTTFGAPIPEPSTAALVGFFGLACWTFRRASRR